MSDQEDSLEERQELEVQALKGIFDTDFVDLRDKDVWKVKRPPEFNLKLRPNHDSKGKSIMRLSTMSKHNLSCLIINLQENFMKTVPSF